MRPKSINTYENLVQYFNRNVSVQTTCECGKILLAHRMEDHLTTGVHKLLMSYKQQCHNLRKEAEAVPSSDPAPEDPEPGKKKKKHRSQWDKFVRDAPPGIDIAT